MAMLHDITHNEIDILRVSQRINWLV